MLKHALSLTVLLSILSLGLFAEERPVSPPSCNQKVRPPSEEDYLLGFQGKKKKTIERKDSLEEENLLACTCDDRGRDGPVRG